jgi:hypothetical protein
MPLSTACKGIVKVQLRICDNHSRSFTGADVPFGACRVTVQARSSLCEQVQKMCSGECAGFSQLTPEGSGSRRGDSDPSLLITSELFLLDDSLLHST